MILRPYQRSALDAVRAALHNRPVLTLPTGGGKTFVAAQLLVETGARTLWLAHRRELIQQAADSINRLGLKVGVVMAGMEPRPQAQVQVASVQTLVRRESPPADLIVVDECHHARANTYKTILDRYPDVPIVGLTATPFRLDGKGLGDIFGEIIVGAYPDDLCNDGTLIEPVVYAPSAPDMSKVHKVAGEYNQRETSEEMSKPKIVGDLVATWLQRAAGRRTIIFAPSVAVSKQYEEAFRQAGVKIEHLDGGTPKAQRDAILTRLRVGYTTIVSNVAVVEEGFDLPALDCAIVARPTASLCLHLQMIGRIMRAAEGKAGATVLDHAGNHLEHGPVTQRLEYSLDDNITNAIQKGKPSPLKTCPDCFLVVNRAATECPECNHKFIGREFQHVDGELVRYDGGAIAPRPRPPLEEQQRAWAAQREARNYKEGWTFFRFEERFGFRPLVHDGTVCDPQTCGEAVKKSIYDRFEVTAKAKNYKPGWAAHQYRAIFGVWPRFRRVG